MDFQHDKSWDNLLEVINSKLTISDSWNQIIDFHESIISKPYWNDLRHFDLASEQNEIKDWLEQLVLVSPLPPTVIALWIGIVKMDYDGKIFSTIYLIGSDTYNKDSIEWACKPTFMPDNRYVIPGILNQIDDIVKTDKGNYEFFDWLLPLAYCALTIDEIIRTKLNTKLFLTSKKKIFIATGHDSGDYLDISSIE